MSYIKQFEVLCRCIVFQVKIFLFDLISRFKTCLKSRETFQCVNPFE